MFFNLSYYSVSAAKIRHSFSSLISQNAEIMIIFTEDYVTLRPILN